MKPKILELIDFEKVDTLLEGFNKSTGFVTAILDLEGNVLSKSGWRQICTEFHRVHPETAKKCLISDTELANKMAEGEKYHFYQCLNGLVDVAVPIVIKGDHIANLFSGQFFFEKPDNSFFQKQADKFGFNRDIYLKALGKVPVISEEKVKVAMDFLLNMTQMISEMTFQKLEQTELNEAVLKSENILRLFVEHSPASIAMFDNNMRYLVASQRFRIDYNLGDQVLIGRSHYEIFPEISERWKDFHRRGLAGETLKEDNDSFPRADGTTDWVRWEIRPWYESDNQIGGIILFSEVITAQIEDREALKESEIYNRMLFEQSAIGLALTSFDGRMVDINSTFSDIIGRTVEEAKALTYWDITPEKYQHQEQQQLESLSKTGHYGPYEKEYIHKDGHLVPVRLQGLVIEQKNEKLIWSSVEDITEQKRSELLRNSENYLLEIITQNAPLPKILEEIVLTVEALSERTIASILLLDDEGIHVHYGAAPHLPEAFNNALEGEAIGINAGSCGTAAYRKEAVIVTDIEVDPLWDDYRELARANGLRACWSTPIINSGGKVLGTFAMYYREPRRPMEEDFKLIERATHLAKIAIERNRKEQELEKGRRLLIESQRIGNVGGWEFNIDTLEQTWTEEVFRIHEVEVDYEPTVETGVNYYTPESRPIIEQAVQRAIEFGKPFDLELEIITAKGNLRSVKAIGEADLEHRRVIGFFQDITERKIAETKLLAEHELVINTLESMSDAFVSLDRNWCYTYMNEKAGAIFCRDPKEMIGKNIWTEFPEGVGQPFHQSYEKAMNEKVFIRMEEYYPPYDMWFENRINPTDDGIAIFFQNITERKKAEEKLKQSETQYRNLIEQAADGIILADTNGNIRKVNSAFCAMLGYTTEELLKLNLSETYPPEERDLMRNRLSEISESDTIRFERNMIRKDKSIIPVEAILAKTSDGLTQGIIRDNTARKQAEEALISAKVKIEESEIRFKAITNQATEGISLSDLDGNYKFVNPAFCLMTGYSEEELLKMTVFDVKAQTQPPGSFIESKSTKVELPIEVKLQRKDKSEFMTEIIGNIIKIGNQDFVLGTVRDITEHKQAEEELRKSEKRHHLLFKYGLAAMAYHQIIFEDDKPVDDIYLEVNDAFTAKTGLHNVIGKSITELIPDIRKTNPELLERFGRVALTGQPEQYEAFIAGLNTWFYTSLYSLGENVVVSVFDNITERKLAEIEIKQRNSELQTLNRLISKTTEVLNLKYRLEFIMDEALQIVGLEGGTICLVKPDNTFELAAHRETSAETIKELTTSQIKIGDCLCCNCALDCRPLILNTPEEVLKYATREVTRGEDIRFHAAMPFMVHGKCVGVLCVFTRTDKKPDHRSLKLLETICTQAAVSVENARLYEDLHESEELLRLSTELANVAAWEYNFVTDTASRSKNHDKLYGLPNQERWNFDTFINAVHPDDREMSNSTIQNSMDIGGPEEYQFDFRVVYPDQSIHWLNIIWKVTKRDAEGKGFLVRGFLIDITRRKQAEAALQLSEEKFNKAFNNSPDAITITRAADGKLIDVNEAFTRISGYKREKVLGNSSLLLNLWQNPDDRARYVSMLKEKGGVKDFEAKFITGEGIERDFLISGEMFLLNNETCILGILRDVTEQKLMQQELDSLNRELEQRVVERTVQLKAVNKELETFTYSVSHDLKAPLRGIDGYSKLLLDLYGNNLNEEAQTFLKTIRSSTLQMNQLIEDLLDYSRLERSQMRNDRLKIGDLIASTASLYKNELVKSNILLTLNIPDIVLVADEKGLTIALRNLIENAIKFTGSKPNPEIEIGVEEQASSWIIHVKDNGIGFDMKYHQRIFEIFQRLHRAEDVSGTGVGLAMVSKAMQRMNGRVWAESTPEIGSTFYLEIQKNKLI